MYIENTPKIPKLQICQKTPLFLDLKKYRYVGVIKGFGTAKIPVLKRSDMSTNFYLNPHILMILYLVKIYKPPYLVAVMKSNIPFPIGILWMFLKPAVVNISFCSSLFKWTVPRVIS